MTNGNEKMPAIEAVLKKINLNSSFGKIERFVYKPFNDNEALAILEAIGKSRNPKFVIDDENRFAYLNFAKWCHCDTSMQCIDPVTSEVRRGDLYKGIYIAGNTGSGKSWLLDIMRAYCSAFGFKVQLSGVKRDLSWLNVRADTICDNFAFKGDMTLYKSVGVLGIQDIGCEPSETVYMGNRVDVVRGVVESRGDKSDVLTLFTSNMRIDGQSLRLRYGDRVQSRLYEMCNYLVIKGKDRRKL